MTNSDSDARAALDAARTEAARREKIRTDAGDAERRAHRAAINHETNAQAARLFGRLPTPGSVRHERLAAERRAEMARHRSDHIAASPAANDAHAEVRHQQEKLERAARHEELVRQDREEERERTRSEPADIGLDELF